MSIIFKQGLKTNLPSSAASGEPLFTTDTYQVYVGTGTGKVELQTISASLVYATNFNSGALNSSTIQLALNDIGAAEKTLILSAGTWTLTSNLNIPSNVRLMLQSGAIIQRSAGTLTINGSIDFPKTTCLKGFSPGNLVFGNLVKTLYIDWTEAVGDGSTDDSLPIYAILQSASNVTIEFSPKTYLINTIQYDTKKNQVIHLNGATLRGGPGIRDNWASILNIGGSKTWIVGSMTPTTVTKGVNHFTAPSGVTINVDDMFMIYDKDNYITGYSYGVLATVTKIANGEIYIDNYPDYTFTADSIAIFYDCSGIEVDGGTFDNATNNVFAGGLSLIGRNFKTKNIKAYGASNASIGISGLVINTEISNCLIRDYTCTAGIPVSLGGGRQGDGIAITGINISIHDNVITDCKHCITLSRREFITNNVTVFNNTMTQDKSHFAELITKADGQQEYYFGSPMDTHGDADNIVVMGNTIESASLGVINVRNGKQVVIGNKLRLLNSSSANCGIINIGETTLTSVHLSDNDIDANTAGTSIVNSYDGTTLLNQSAIKFSNNNISNNVMWKGCTLKGNRLYSTSAPTSYTWDIGEEIWNISPTIGSTLLYRCVSGGSPGTWESISMSTVSVSNASYGSNWNGDTTTAPSKNAVYGKIEQLLLASGSGAGNVIGPISAVDGHVVAFDGISGTQIKDGYGVGTGALNLVQLDGNQKLPAVDASNLTNLPNITKPTYTITTTDVTASPSIIINPASPSFTTANTTVIGVNFNSTANASPASGTSWRYINVNPQYSGIGVMPDITGVFVSPRNIAAGRVSSLTGFTTWLRNTHASGIVDQMRGIYVQTPTNANTTANSVSTSMGIQIDNQGMSGTPTNYALYILDQTLSTSNYAIKTGLGTVSFGDKVGIGLTSPAEKLDIVNGNLKLNGFLKLDAVPAPSGALATLNASAGNLSGNYSYKISFVTANGETELGTVSNTVSGVSQQISLSNIPLGQAGVTARKLYRTKTGGAAYYYLTTINDNTTTTYLDNTLDASLGIACQNKFNNTVGLTVGSSKFLVSSTNGTYFGYNAGNLNSTSVLSGNYSGYNVAIGTYAGNVLTTGGDSVFVGHYAGGTVTTGNRNTFIGINTGSTCVTGSDNVTVGAYSLQNATGSENTAIGSNSGVVITTGTRNTFIGKGSGYTGNGTITTSIAIGYNSAVTASNTCVIGGSTIGSDAVTIQNGPNTFSVSPSGAVTASQLGVGTGSAAYSLDINSAIDGDGIRINTTTGKPTIRFSQSGGENGKIWAEGGSGKDLFMNAGRYLQFQTQGVTRLQIFQDGTVVFGGAIQRAGAYQFAKDQGNSGLWSQSAGNGFFPYIALAKANGTLASPTAVTSAQDLGEIQFAAHNGTDYINSCSIKGTSAETWSSTGQGFYLSLHTRQIGSNATPTERIRIFDDGGVQIGGTYGNSPGNNNLLVAGNVKVGASFSTPISSTSSNITLDTSNYTILCSGTAQTITLPSANGITGTIYNIKKTSTSGTVTIATTSSQTIDGNNSININIQYQNVTVQSDGTNWYII